MGGVSASGKIGLELQLSLSLSLSLQSRVQVKAGGEMNAVSSKTGQSVSRPQPSLSSPSRPHRLIS